MNQILPNLRIACLCSFFITAAALSPAFFKTSKQTPHVGPVAHGGLEILALKR